MAGKTREGAETKADAAKSTTAAKPTGDASVFVSGPTAPPPAPTAAKPETKTTPTGAARATEPARK